MIISTGLSRIYIALNFGLLAAISKQLRYSNVADSEIYSSCIAKNIFYLLFEIYCIFKQLFIDISRYFKNCLRVY